MPDMRCVAVLQSSVPNAEMLMLPRNHLPHPRMCANSDAVCAAAIGNCCCCAQFH